MFYYYFIHKIIQIDQKKIHANLNTFESKIKTSYLGFTNKEEKYDSIHKIDLDRIKNKTIILKLNFI